MVLAEFSGCGAPVAIVDAKERSFCVFTAEVIDEIVVILQMREVSENEGTENELDKSSTMTPRVAQTH